MGFAEVLEEEIYKVCYKYNTTQIVFPNTHGFDEFRVSRQKW